MPGSVAVEDVAYDNDVDIDVPDQGDTDDVPDSVGIENVANDNDVDIDDPDLEQSGDDGVILPVSVHTASNSVVAEDLCLQLEESFSSSDDDISVLGADPAFNFKPPKKAKRAGVVDVEEVARAGLGGVEEVEVQAWHQQRQAWMEKFMNQLLVALAEGEEGLGGVEVLEGQALVDLQKTRGGDPEAPKYHHAAIYNQYSFYLDKQCNDMLVKLVKKIFI